MTGLAEQILARVGGDASKVTCWETFPTPVGSDLQAVRDQLAAFDRSPAKFCGYGGGLLAQLTAGDVDELRRAGARWEAERQPPVPPDRW